MAKQAAINVRKLKLIPCFGKQRFSYQGEAMSLTFYTPSIKPWFHQMSIPRNQIVLISRIRSNHYNFNYSLYRKNIIQSAACECEESHQDIIFYCSKTRPFSGFHPLSPPPQPFQPGRHFSFSPLPFPQTLPITHCLPQVL